MVSIRRPDIDDHQRLLAAERDRAERLLNAVRLVVLALLCGAALAYAPSIPRPLNVVNTSLLAITLAWTLGQHRLFYNRDRLPGWLSVTNFVVDIIRQIYETKVNALIPWAAVQTSKWVGGDPNPGTAFRVNEDCGCYSVLPGYYFLKQISRAGQPGTAVARVRSSEPSLHVAAFARNGTEHPDAMVVVNTTRSDRPLTMDVRGTTATRFAAFRTMTAGADRYASLGVLEVKDGRLALTAAEGSATTLIAQ